MQTIHFLIPGSNRRSIIFVCAFQNHYKSNVENILLCDNAKVKVLLGKISVLQFPYFLNGRAFVIMVTIITTWLRSEEDCGHVFFCFIFSERFCQPIFPPWPPPYDDFCLRQFFHTYTWHFECIRAFALTIMAKKNMGGVLSAWSKSWMWNTGHFSSSMVAILAI